VRSHQQGVDAADLGNSAYRLFLPAEIRIFINESIYCPNVAVSPHLNALASGLTGDERKVGACRVITVKDDPVTCIYHGRY
jgi:hypothetical protein